MRKGNRWVIFMIVHDSDYEEILALLEEYLKVEALFIMGSYANGSQCNNSDLDLLLISEDFKGIPQFKRKLLVNNIVNSPTKVDPICLTINEFNNVSTTDRDFFLEDMILIKGDIQNERFSNK